MSSTVLDRCLVALAFALASISALAKDVPPRMMQEPIFGLQLETAKVKLDELPDEVRNKCFEIADNEYLTGRQWIYAMTRDADATYYVVSGYYERRNPGPGEARYRVDTLGGVYRIKGAKCLGIGPALEVFRVRPFSEAPQPVLHQLAADLATRLTTAFGGSSKLRAKLRSQQIDRDGLGPELLEAFGPFFQK